jgi:hypothetical protein
MVRVVVLGAAGQLGREVVGALALQTVQTVFRVADEAEPRRPVAIGGWMVMRCENPANDILINRYTERQGDLFGNARTSPARITLFHIDNRTNQIQVWTFGSDSQSKADAS